MLCKIDEDLVQANVKCLKLIHYHKLNFKFNIHIIEYFDDSPSK